jgi:hypothetical protein
MWPVYVPPAPPLPDPAESQTVDRHAGMWCGCLLLDCSHNELPGVIWNLGQYGRHVEWGSPASGYLYPWEPDDESWREYGGIPGARSTAVIQKR